MTNPNLEKQYSKAITSKQSLIALKDISKLNVPNSLPQSKNQLIDIVKTDSGDYFTYNVIENTFFDGLELLSMKYFDYFTHCPDIANHKIEELNSIHKLIKKFPEYQTNGGRRMNITYPSIPEIKLKDFFKLVKSMYARSLFVSVMNAVSPDGNSLHKEFQGENEETSVKIIDRLEQGAVNGCYLNLYYQIIAQHPKNILDINYPPEVIKVDKKRRRLILPDCDIYTTNGARANNIYFYDIVDIQKPIILEGNIFPTETLEIKLRNKCPVQFCIDKSMIGSNPDIKTCLLAGCLINVRIQNKY